MIPKAVREKLSKAFGGKNRIRLIMLLGITAIILIFISELLPKGGSSKSTVSSEPPEQPPSGADYSADIEQRLASMLSQIRGVGKTELILSVEGSEEYIYAEEVETETEQKDSEAKEKYKNKLFVSERTGGKDALVKKTLNPRFNGALVICEGGGDASVRERVIKAVSAALDLPSSKICVECRKI